MITNPIPVIRHGMERGMPALRAGPPCLDRWHAAGAGSCLISFSRVTGIYSGFGHRKILSFKYKQPVAYDGGKGTPPPWGSGSSPWHVLPSAWTFPRSQSTSLFSRGSYKEGRGGGASQQSFSFRATGGWTGLESWL